MVSFDIDIHTYINNYDGSFQQQSMMEGNILKMNKCCISQTTYFSTYLASFSGVYYALHSFSYISYRKRKNITL